MRPFILRHAVISPACKTLSSLSGKQQMDAHQAHVMMVAIALQESMAKHRWQIKGPARGYWQFEKHGGMAGVLSHSSTRNFIESYVGELDFHLGLDALWEALPFSELLQAGFARLLLWTHPHPLPMPTIDNEEHSWQYYKDLWRPGKPRREHWTECWKEALEICGDF